ncbi:6190_t:CDS:2, partial [Funneliformis geosporum]
LEKLGGGDILELLVAADELILEELIYPLQEFLLKHKQKWIQDNILYVLNTVIERNACSKLRSHCLSIVCPEPQRYFDSKEFMDLDETTLVSINTSGLVSPGTSPSEMSPILSSNIFHLSNYISSLSNHFITNQTNDQTLSPPISPSVIPLSLPERTIDSTIITHQQAALIACWIDRKSVSESTPQIDLFPIPYIFRLLFRGSRDGFSAATFHNKCDGQGATIVVVRVGETKELIGGYNPIGWSSPRDVEWRGTRDSFIFSLTNPYCDAHRSNNNIISKSKISRIKKDGINEAIQLHDRLGPSFGFYELKIIDNAHQGTSSYASGVC